MFIGLLELDPTSYLQADDWRPTWSVDDTASGFRTTDLLRMAGVDPDRRNQWADDRGQSQGRSSDRVSNGLRMSNGQWRR
ncbi:MAG: hypothetical protein HRT86_07505 [Ilumatobacteraceae bacterium]|nr:hypothetical protein [Ilumatobacteraceae bacterium]